ncbi:MAG TPA: VOC family protein [Thermoanaerobaculia bacterium]|jgi:PhnB protein
MAGNVKPIPEGYHRVTPYLIVKGAADAIEYYKAVFGANELMRFPGPDGKIGHAEIKIGDTTIMLADEVPEMGHKSPRTLGGTPISLLIYVESVDRTVDRAVAAGAKLVRPVEDQFYGDRTGGIVDPFGHEWYVATHVEDVAPEELRKRSEEKMAQAAAK